MIRVLTKADVAAVLTLPDCISAVEQAFRDYDRGCLPKSESLGLRAVQGTFHVKAARANVFAAKVNANFPGNPRQHGLPTIQGLIVVMDTERGTPLAVLDSALITTLRTAAATAVAAKYLSQTGADTAAVIGCGSLGRATVLALCEVRPIRRVQFWDLDDRVMSATCEVLKQTVKAVEIVQARSLEDAVQNSQVIVTCTTAAAPFLEPRHVRPGAFVAAVGADNPQKCEIAPALMAEAQVVPDLLEQALAMGDLRHAIAEGVITHDDIHGELGAIVNGRIPGRSTSEEVFIFDSTGTALQDVVVASIAIDRAASRGIGLAVSMDAEGS